MQVDAMQICHPSQSIMQVTKKQVIFDNKINKLHVCFHSSVRALRRILYFSASAFVESNSIGEK